MRGMKENIKNQLTILHISDFHFNNENLYDINIVLDELLIDLNKLKKEYNLNPSVVLISGDIASSSDTADYNIAHQCINKLLGQLQIGVDKIFIIPGNHDVNRKVLRKYSKIVLKNEGEINKFLKGEKSEIEYIKTKFNNFLEFKNNFYGKDDPYNYDLYFSKSIDINNNTIGIVGINSSWFSGENRITEEYIHDPKALLIGEIQLRELYDKVKDVDLCISFVHHPFSWLADFDEQIVKRMVMKNSHFIFSGHLHTPSVINIENPDSSCVVLSAGASYTQKGNKCYNITQIDLDEYSYKIFLRRFSEENRFWSSDTLSYQSGEGIIYGKIRGKESLYSDIVYPFEELDEDILLFIEKNWKGLVLNPAMDSAKVINLRKTFFTKKKKTPTLREIALGTLKYLLDNKMIKSVDELNSILDNSGFLLDSIESYDIKKIKIYFNEDYFRKKNAEIIFNSREDIALLKEREFLVKKQREISDIIERKYKQEYDERKRKLDIRQKEMEQEYALFKSKIDEYSSVEETYLPKITKPEEKPRAIWYQELGLLENPFPSHIGLEGFNKEIYNDIIVKTKVYHRFDREITMLPKSMSRHTYLVYGVMGSGKTTLFKYLQQNISILRHQSMTIVIPLEAQPFEKLRYDFYQKLFEKLEKIYFSTCRIPIGFETSVINDRILSYIFQQIIDNSDIDHFIIFLDDLHKHPKYIEEVFEFISGLQIFRSYMYENGIDLTFFISGDVTWIQSSVGVKAIGGSIDIKEKIPEITTQEAVDMINKRLKKFALKPDKPPIIKDEYINKIFKILKTRLPYEITFRDIIEEVENHWSRYEFESLELSVALDYNTLVSMLLDMESDHPIMKEKIDKIWDYSNEDETIFNEFVQIMEKLLIQKGIEEEDNYFITNIDYFGYLYRVGIISKQRRDKAFNWILINDINKMFEKFVGKYGFYPSEYLSKLYFTDKYERKYVSEENSRMNLLLNTGGQYGNIFLDNIKSANDSYVKIYNNIKSLQDEIGGKGVVDLCMDSIKSITKSIAIVSERREIVADTLDDVYDSVIDTWFENPDIGEFISSINRKKEKEMDFNEEDINEICRNYFRAMKSSISFILRTMKYNNVFSLDSKIIKNDNKKLLNSIRRNYFNENYEIAINKLNNLLVDQLNDLIYTSNCIVYGPNKWKRGLPQDINEKILKYGVRETNDKSVLYCLNLVDLTNICLNSNKYLESLYIELFGKDIWNSIKTNFFLEKELQNVNEQSKIVRRKDDILHYILNGKNVIESIDNLYSKLFSNKLPFYLNFQDFKIIVKPEDKVLKEYKTDKKLKVSILEKIKSEHTIELNLSRYIPNPSFESITFFDWIVTIYELKVIENKISITISPNGIVILF